MQNESHRKSLWLLLASVVLVSLGPARLVAQRPTTAVVRVQLVAANQQLQVAKKYFAAEKYEEAGKAVAEADRILANAPKSNDFATKAARKKLVASVTAAKAMLAKRGVTVAPPGPAGDAKSAKQNKSPADGSMQEAVVEGGVSFIKQIAPLLEENCMHCHGGDETRARLRLVTFEGIQRGGNNGVLFRAGNVRNSLLLQRLKGEGDGEQMPPDSDPLSSDQIALIEKWISEGAIFDGGDPALNIPELVMQFEVNKLSHEDLWKQRAEFVPKNWELGMPGIKATTFETKTLRLMGTAAKDEIESIANSAESRMAKVAELLSVPANEPLLKGGATIYVVTRRYDYSEFGQMVEQRTLPRGSHGHWRYSGRDAYGVVLAGDADSFSKDALVAEQVAGLSLASRGFPKWFAEGVGLAIAGRLEAKDARVLALRAEAKQVLRGGVPAKKFLAGELPPDESRLIAFAFGERLLSSKKSWGKLMASIVDGQSFDEAFANAYRGSPESILTRLSTR